MKFFHSIRRKVRLCINVAFIGFLLATVFTLGAQFSLKRNLQEIRDLDFHLALKSIELLNAFEHQCKLYEESFLFGLGDAALEANRASEKIIQQIQTMAGLAAREHRLHDYRVRSPGDLKDRYVAYFTRASRLYPELARGTDPEEYREEMRQLTAAQQEILAEMKEMTAFFSRAFERDVDAIIDFADRRTVALIAYFVALLLLMSLIANRVANRMLIRPLGEIKEAVRRFGQGERNLPGLRSMDPQDEIGELGTAFLQMTDQLDRTTVSKAYVDSILKNMSDSLVVVDTALRIQTVNQAALDLLGYRGSDLAGRDFRLIAEEFHFPPGEAADGGVFRYLRDRLICHNAEKTFRARDGTEIPVLLSTSLLFDANNILQGLVCVAKDITERRRSQEEQKRQHEFLLNVFESISHPFYVINVDDHTISLSNSAAAGNGAGTGLTCHQLTHNSDRPCSGIDHICPLRQVVQTRQPVKVEHVHGEQVFEVHGYPVFDPSGAVVQMIEYSLDITSRKQTEKKLEQLARYDFLTGLYNRRSFQDRLHQAISLAQREHHRAGLMFFDLDRFKIINDSLGHAFGDALLQAIARRLSKCMRESDSIARLGGDEFAVLLPRVTGMEDLVLLAKRLLEALAIPICHEGQEIFTSGSLGIAVFPQHGSTADELLRNADQAMYRAKQAGGNTFCVYSETAEGQNDRLRLETGLRNALGRREYLLHYQPIVDFRSGSISGREALLRWQPAAGDLVFPERFIPILEDSGLIVQVGEWVLRTACAQNRAWLESGQPPARISVNISARQFKSDLIETVRSVLEETGLAPHYLELELTESLFLENQAENIDILHGLKTLGLSLAIDDFGTGYSSLNYLKHFPVDRVKIDRCFVETASSVSGGEIARTIIDMAHSLNLRVVGEGIETAAQLRFLRKSGCDEGQGFLLGHPQPVAETPPALPSRAAFA